MSYSVACSPPIPFSCIVFVFDLFKLLRFKETNIYILKIKRKKESFASSSSFLLCSRFSFIVFGFNIRGEKKRDSENPKPNSEN